VRFLKPIFILAFALILAGGAVRPAFAQNATTTDIERLQDSLADASRAVDEMRNRETAAQLQKQLDALRDEATYLKVKIQKNEAVSRTEYFEMRDKVDDIRSRARRDGTPAASGSSSSSSSSSTSSSSPSSRSSSPMEVPVGTELDVRTQQSLSSAVSQIEDRFEATTLVDLSEGNRVIVPSGSTLRGVVSAVNKAGRLDRKGSLTLAFDQVTIHGRNYPIRATVTQAIESEGIKGEAGKIGAGAGVGAIIGGILGGVKGALAGILIGGGGTVAATDGKDVELPAGTVLRIRLDSGLNTR
jgi:hypothetical protein